MVAERAFPSLGVGPTLALITGGRLCRPQAHRGQRVRLVEGGPRGERGVAGGQFLTVQWGVRQESGLARRQPESSDIGGKEDAVCIRQSLEKEEGDLDIPFIESSSRKEESRR